MPKDLEAIAFRPMVVEGRDQPDDYEVVWRGLSVGRMLKQPDSQYWWWGCNLYGRDLGSGDRGFAMDFKDCRLRFKLAWARIRASLTDREICIAIRHAEQQAHETNAPERTSASELQSLDNRRAAPRQRVLKTATIEFGARAVECVVRNLSERGAAIDVANPVGIPDRFSLLLSGTRLPQCCRVVWQRNKRIGVAFEQIASE